MLCEPVSLEALRLLSGKSDGRMTHESVFASHIMCGVNGMFTPLSHMITSIAFRVRLREGLSEHIESVVGVDISASTEIFQERSVLSFPSEHLRISTLEVGVEDDIAFVRDEELTDVREAKVLPRRRA